MLVLHERLSWPGAEFLKALGSFQVSPYQMTPEELADEA